MGERALEMEDLCCVQQESDDVCWNIRSCSRFILCGNHSCTEAEGWTAAALSTWKIFPFAQGIWVPSIPLLTAGMLDSWSCPFSFPSPPLQSPLIQLIPHRAVRSCSRTTLWLCLILQLDLFSLMRWFRDLFKMPPRWGVSGMSYWGKASGKTSLLADCGTPWCPPLPPPGWGGGGGQQDKDKEVSVCENG